VASKGPRREEDLEIHGVIGVIGLRWFVEIRNLVSSNRNRCVIRGDGTRRQNKKGHLRAAVAESHWWRG